MQAADVYRPVKEIAIGGEDGWDYLIVDPAAHRLYTSHATKITPNTMKILVFGLAAK